MKTLYLVAILLLTTLCLSAQSKKKVRELDIQTKTTWKVDYVDGKEVKNKEKEEKFTTSGKIAEYIEYDADGSTKSHIKYDYSSEGKLVKEQIIGKNGAVEETYEYSYLGKLKTEKRKLNAKGKLVSKKIYEYKTHQ